MFFLEAEFVGLRCFFCCLEMWRLLAFGGCFRFEVAVRRRNTPPAPLERGVLDTAFCLIMSYLIGDEGECYGEMCGMG